MHAWNLFVFLSLLSVVVVALPAHLTVPQLPELGCASLQGNETCTECVAACASAFILCTTTCIRRPAQCEVFLYFFTPNPAYSSLSSLIGVLSLQKACIQRFSSWGGCKTCLPECIPKKDEEALACASSLVHGLNGTSSLASAPNPDPPPTAHVVSVPGWKYKGCYNDAVKRRALAGKKWKGYLTVERCAHVCKGYRYFGVEYSNEYVTT